MQLRKVSGRSGLAILWQYLIRSTPDFFQDALGGVGPTAAFTTESAGRLESLEKISKAGFYRFVRASTARDLFRTPRDGGLFGPRFGDVGAEEDEQGFHLQRDLFVRRPSDVYVQLNQLKAQQEQFKDPKLSEQDQQLQDLEKRIQQFRRAWFRQADSPSVYALPPLVRVFRAKVALARYPLLNAGIRIGMGSLLWRFTRHLLVCLKTPICLSPIGTEPSWGGIILGGLSKCRVLSGMGFKFKADGCMGGHSGGGCPGRGQIVLARAMNMADVKHLANVEKAIEKRCEMGNMLPTQQVPSSLGTYGVT
eukprot:g2849.t1